MHPNHPLKGRQSLIGLNLALPLEIFIAFVLVSYFAKSHTTTLLNDIYFPTVTFFCSPEPSQVLAFPLSIRGAVLPIVMSLLLVATWIRNWESVVALASSTVAICLMAYHYSEVIPGGGIITNGVLLGTVSGLLALFTMGIYPMIKYFLDRNELAFDIGSLAARLRIAIAVGYFSGVVGTLVGADLLRSCVLLQEIEIITIGGAGAWDAIYLAGAFSLMVTGTLWIIAYMVDISESQYH